MRRIELAVLVLCGFLVGVSPCTARAEEAPKPAAAKPPAAADTPASHVSWTFLEAGYVYENVDHADDQPINGISDFDDGSGLRFGLSFQAYKYFHVVADYSWVAIRSSDGPDLTTVFAGLGAHYAILDGTDVYGDLGYDYFEARSNISGVKDSEDADDGVGLRAGVRSLVLPNLELGLRAAYADLDSDAVVTGRFGVRYYVTNAIALSTDIDYDNDNYLTVFAGFRFDFSRQS